jgi:hypothetical protein
MALNDDIHGTDIGRDERDPGLSRIYGAARPVEPPAHLDAAILAAAHREVGARPRRLAALRTWRVPVSIAAVVVLSVSLVTLVREEGGDELYQTPRPEVPRPVPPAARAPQPPDESAKAVARDMAPPGQGAPRVEAPASRPAETRDRVASETQRRAQGGVGSSAALEPAPKPDPKPFQNAPESRGERPAGPPPAMDDSARAPAVIMERSPAPTAAPPPDVAAGTSAEARRAPPPPAKPAPPRAMRSEREISREDAAGSVLGGFGAPAPRAAEAPRAPGELAAQQRESVPPMPPRVAAIVKELDAQPPEKWLERIHLLSREGQPAEVRDLLAEFKRRYPAHPLPPELQ